MFQKSVEIPTIDWNLAKSNASSLELRCPFATTETCPRFYQSLSLLGLAGSTKIPEKNDKKLLKKWKKSPLWPVTNEQATSISGPNNRYKNFSNFCPELSFERFGYFATGLYGYSDEVDMEHAHTELSRLNASRDDWRWLWASLEPQHYSECPLYSILLNSSKVGKWPNEDIVEIKPNFWGIGFNLIALLRRLIRPSRK